MPTIQNNLSRQRSFRILKPVDDWLLKRARSHRKKDKDSRAGVATEGNAILIAAFKADPANASKLHLIDDAQPD